LIIRKDQRRLWQYLCYPTPSCSSKNQLTPSSAAGTAICGYGDTLVAIGGGSCAEISLDDLAVISGLKQMHEVTLRSQPEELILTKRKSPRSGIRSNGKFDDPYFLKGRTAVTLRKETTNSSRSRGAHGMRSVTRSAHFQAVGSWWGSLFAVPANGQSGIAQTLI
jgi:hypothetical protein